MSTAQLDQQMMEHLNERQRRLYAGTKALQYGYGGMSRTNRELGVDFKTIRQGIKDVTSPPLRDRVRRAGGGRKKAVVKYPEIPDIIAGLI